MASFVDTYNRSPRGKHSSAYNYVHVVVIACVVMYKYGPILPFLMMGVIFFAKMKKYKLHQVAQYILFVVSVIVVAYFEIGVRIGGGFNLVKLTSNPCQ